MKTVVFGGSGFLGSHVADELTNRGHQVTIFDLRPSPYISKQQSMVVGDITDTDLVRTVLEDADVAYQFADMADLDGATTKPVETIKRNVLGTATLLTAAVDTSVKRFVYASTVYVYSDLGGFYRCSKQAGEIYVEEYQRQYGLNCTILRYGSLYGPRADSRNSLFRYLKQALAEHRILYAGFETDVREYIHVRDAATLSVDALGDEFKGCHIVISGNHPTKATDLLKMIEEILNRPLHIEYANVPSRSHYAITPYSFTPKVGDKLVSNRYTDMGQGLLECLHEIHASGTSS